MNDFWLGVISTIIGIFIGFLFSLLNQLFINRKEKRLLLEQYLIRFKEEARIYLEYDLGVEHNFKQGLENFTEANKKAYIFYSLIKLKAQIPVQTNELYKKISIDNKKIVNAYLKNGFSTSLIIDFRELLDQFDNFTKSLDDAVIKILKRKI